MQNLKIDLINEIKISLEEVMNSLLDQKFGTKWAEKTSEKTLAYARRLGDVYGDAWYKGFLPEEFFLQILLPKHGHYTENKNNILSFIEDTAVHEARDLFNQSKEKYNKDCIELVIYLKEEIRKNGFKTNISLVIIKGKLKHVDGLHRMIALSLLLKEGYKYEPIPVFLCDSTK